MLGYALPSRMAPLVVGRASVQVVLGAHAAGLGRAAGGDAADRMPPDVHLDALIRQRRRLVRECNLAVATLRQERSGREGGRAFQRRQLHEAAAEGDGD